MVNPFAEGGIGRPTNCEVPIEEVGVGGRGSLIVCGRSVGEFRCFADLGLLAMMQEGRRGLRIRFIVGDLELNLGVAMMV